MIKAIYNAKPTYKVYPKIGFCRVWITVDNETFHGGANIHPEDKLFFSEKVGLNIALSRARTNALKYEVKKLKNISDIKHLMYKGSIGVDPEKVDPTGQFLKNVEKTDKELRQLRQALKKERKWLNDYLQGQDRAISIIKRNRARANQDN